MSDIFCTLRQLLEKNASTLELSIADDFTRVAMSYIDTDKDLNDEQFLIVYIHSIALAKIVTRRRAEIPKHEYEAVRKILTAVNTIVSNSTSSKPQQAN